MGWEFRRDVVVVVDDDPNVCSMLNQMLDNAGFACWTCTSGEAVLQKLERDEVALVVCDLRLPELSRMDLLERVRRKSPSTKFIMITGEDDIRRGMQAIAQGVADYLIRPLQPALVVASVAHAMEMRRLELDVQNCRQKLDRMVQDRTRQLQLALKRVELTCDETLGAMGAALDLHDSETAGHCQRVSHYSIEIGKLMGCSSEQLRQLARGAYLHDIGKIGIPDSIRRKPSKLTEAETAIMRTHVAIGYELVSRIPFLAGAADIILTHHECYDGTGYPQGLVAEEIQLQGRIFAIADTLDAMTSDRPYRRALPFSVARAEIVRQLGHRFDPIVVQAFLTVPSWSSVKTQIGLSDGPPLSWTSLAANLGDGLSELSPQVAWHWV